MNRNELKENYVHIMDTDNLIDKFMEMATKYGHRNTEHGVCEVLTEFFEQNMTNIKLMQKSPNYKGDLRIITDIEVPIEFDVVAVKQIISSILNLCQVKERLVKYVDDKGKTIGDYTKIGTSFFNISDLTNEVLEKLLNDSLNPESNVNNFDCNGAYLPSVQLCSETCYYLRLFKNESAELSEGLVNELEHETKFKGKFATGMKTSRAFNRVWDICGLNAEKMESTIRKAYKDWNVGRNKTLRQFLQSKAGKEVAAKFGYKELDNEKRNEIVMIVNAQSEYNKLFAELSDLWRTKKRKLKFIISLNPLDYMGMSFGVNWRSCHTIDSMNYRHVSGTGYNGMYMNGVISYMLDSTSFITYCLDEIPEVDIHEKGKVYRTMFHYKDFVLIQGRVYPQGNDGKTDLYKLFRGAMQKELSACLGIENKWYKPNQRMPFKIESRGRHYRDYNHFTQCNTSYPKEKKEELEERFYDNTGEIYMTIGHDPICINCGRDQSVWDIPDNALTHARCPITVE